MEIYRWLQVSISCKVLLISTPLASILIKSFQHLRGRWGDNIEVGAFFYEHDVRQLNELMVRALLQIVIASRFTAMIE